jgi:cyclopropane-fatty-acyl-phospholipid synthase
MSGRDISPEKLSLALPRQAAIPRAGRTLLKLLSGLQHGSLTLHTPDGAQQVFGNPHQQPHADWYLHDWGVCEAVLASSDIGLGETYMDGRWHSNNIPALVALAIVNRSVLEQAIRGSLFSLLGYRLRHTLRANSRAGSRKNILAHYDLGNDFYRLWLDSSMTYSAALFENDAQRPLPQAQAAKYTRILDQLGLNPGHRVLEIGCGWGGFAEAAAERGAHLHGITLSPSQLAYAQARIAHFPEQVRPQLSLTDYRDIRGQYDHIVSIEMFEAVGERYWPTYFRALKTLLKPGGSALIQTITIANELFKPYRRSTDFIQQYVFPGGMLPSISVFKEYAHKAGLRVVEAHAFGQDYAETLRRWRARFHDTWAQAQKLGFDERFRRLWDFYLAYCEAGFAAGSTHVYQVKLAHV